ncbi:MAG: glutamate 2,3-aminomutase [Eubacteriales bacterium]|nr:glutamate 2,3-aminomutase [Eubacteriales bacterium]MDD3074004.1 glutamate 2,3-aminomutase [Eubacteriales bacterium]MDD4078588.1 glutamate 2,3-aminomutase [Eubacteriales bacterium]MDD4768552.1 glutamate 2,3-aminomutase [Eubacteriales bacterium]
MITSESVAAKRRQANVRAQELRERIGDFLEASATIPTGTGIRERIETQKNRILKLLGGSERDWNSWQWQLSNRITEAEVLKQIINLSPGELDDIRATGAKFRWAVSPYYASLMDPDDPNCPIRLQSVPKLAEVLDENGTMDPMAEELTSPVTGITRRYPDRLIINVTNQCAMYCRHCQRRRNIGETDKHTPKKHLQECFNYIRLNPEIRDVLLTGGDAFLLSDKVIDWLLTELDAIPTVEIKRLGTRTPVTMPQRITPELCAILERHHPVYVNTQFNHPLEVTNEAREACSMLAGAGVPLGNQAVLLAGINDNAHVMKKLNHELLKIRVRPYYIFHAKNVRGTMHFGTSIETGIEIMDKLRGYTSGLAVPTYVINAPHGFGKTPILPDYMLWLSPDQAVLRTWENRIISYPNQRAK